MWGVSHWITWISNVGMIQKKWLRHDLTISKYFLAGFQRIYRHCVRNTKERTQRKRWSETCIIWWYHYIHKPGHHHCRTLQFLLVNWRRKRRYRNLHDASFNTIVNPKSKGDWSNEAVYWQHKDSYLNNRISSLFAVNETTNDLSTNCIGIEKCTDKRRIQLQCRQFFWGTRCHWQLKDFLPAMLM